MTNAEKLAEIAVRCNDPVLVLDVVESLATQFNKAAVQPQDTLAFLLAIQARLPAGTITIKEDLA